MEIFKQQTGIKGSSLVFGRKTIAHAHSSISGCIFLPLLALAISVLLVLANILPTAVVYAQSGDWPTYMGNNQRSGFNAAETIINPTSAPHLKEHWRILAAGAVTSQPIAANGMLYWGSWDGLEHATNPSTGQDVWTASLGQSAANCFKTKYGVLSSAALAFVTINGVKTPVVFVAGGDVKLYALNANTGAIIWSVALGTAPDYFLFGSPAVYKGSVYIGVASHGDCPLIQGQLVELKAATGGIEHTFNVVPNGCTGGSIWIAPAIDVNSGMIYVGTGNGGTCTTNETMAVALVEIRASDLSYVASWQIPASQQTSDGDFGSTATLFQATIGGVVHRMVGLLNKNGIYYAFDRDNIGQGPLWQVQLAAPASKGENNVSSTAWDGTNLYAAAASTTINGGTCNGSLRALNPATGAFIWQVCLANDVFGSVTAVPGLVEVGSGPSILIMSAADGSQLFAFQDNGTSSKFTGPGSISNGVLYQGNVDGYLYALGM